MDKQIISNSFKSIQDNISSSETTYIILNDGYEFPATGNLVVNDEEIYSFNLLLSSWFMHNIEPSTTSNVWFTTFE